MIKNKVLQKTSFETPYLVYNLASFYYNVVSFKFRQRTFDASTVVNLKGDAAFTRSDLLIIQVYHFLSVQPSLYVIAFVL